ncbi:MAG: NAD(P)-dependent oxidoreductase [Bacteriovoracaceae bacterium]|nr:NAD(P)-dependent oxidoreductase [Bacteriovoracaceae bacterium]
MNILITGGTGCLGLNLIQHLNHLGHKIFFTYRVECNNTSGKGILFDLLKEDPFPNFEETIDVFIHTAAVVAGPNFVATSNETMTKKALEWAKHLKVKQFIFISSCSVAGDIYNGQRNECSIMRPDSQYGVSKLNCEKIVKEYLISIDIFFTIMRPGLIYGPYDRGGMLKVIQSLEQGTFKKFGSGSYQKSPCSVSFLSKILVQSLLNRDFYNEEFIVVDDSPITVNEMIDVIAKNLNIKPQIQNIPAWILPIIGYICDLLKVLGKNIPFTTKTIKKMVSNNTYSNSKVKGRLQTQVESNFEDEIKKELDWYKRFIRKGL